MFVWRAFPVDTKKYWEYFGPYIFLLAYSKILPSAALDQGRFYIHCIFEGSYIYSLIRISKTILSQHTNSLNALTRQNSELLLIKS
jgi:hypothetical protein